MASRTGQRAGRLHDEHGLGAALADHARLEVLCSERADDDDAAGAFSETPMSATRRLRLAPQSATVGTRHGLTPSHPASPHLHERGAGGRRRHEHARHAQAHHHAAALRRRTGGAPRNTARAARACVSGRTADAPARRARLCARRAAACRCGRAQRSLPLGGFAAAGQRCRQESHWSQLGLPLALRTLPSARHSTEPSILHLPPLSPAPSSQGREVRLHRGTGHE